MLTHVNSSTINEVEAINRLKALPRPWAKGYYALYSSWINGIIHEPWLMSVPIDDHAFHRGDGVFEMIKCVNRRIYQFDRHLERLAASAQAIQLTMPVNLNILKHLGIAVIKAAKHTNCALRIYITRGPGGFTTNPQECPKPGIYIIASKLVTPNANAYTNGVCIGISSMPIKNGFYASIKSCNYLPNVLLKTEAIHRGWDYAISLDKNGNLAEGSSENLGIVDHTGRLLLPQSDYILEGVTVRRAQELALDLVASGLLKSIENCNLTIDDLQQAREAMLFGTTLDVLPITRLENHLLGKGEVGPVARDLLTRMRKDLAKNPNVSTLI